MLYDVEGNEYIDFGGGIAVMNIGHSNPKVVKAIQDQAEKFTHTCFMVTPYESAVKLGAKLCKIAPGKTPKRAILINSGAEAVENTVKIARYYTKRQGIVVQDHAFHGRTLLCMTMTSKVKPYKWGFGPFAPEVYRIPNAYCYRCPFGLTYPKCDCACADYMKDFFGKIAPDMLAAVVVEPVQGEGGFITPPKEYFPKLAKICKDNGILFIADEIQSGMARTGKQMFAIEHWGVEPDLMTVAKSLAAGMPLSAVVGRQEIMDSVHPGGIGGTYGGNPVCCAAALAVLDVYEEEDARQEREARQEGQEVLQRAQGQARGHRRRAGSRPHARPRTGQGPQDQGAGPGRNRCRREVRLREGPEHPVLRPVQQRHPHHDAARHYGLTARQGRDHPRRGLCVAEEEKVTARGAAEDRSPQLSQTDQKKDPEEG